MKPGRMLLTVLMGTALAACGTPPDRTASPAPVATGRPSATPAATSTPTRSKASTPSPTSAETPPPVADDPPELALEPVASGLSAPTNVVGLPDGRLLVTERQGRILVVDAATGEATEVASLADRVTPGLDGSDERGLLGLALPPDWPSVGRAFVHYTDGNGDTVLSELAGDQAGGTPRLDAGSELVLLRVDQPRRNHNGGQLAFGPDGHLWMGLGDGGGGGDPLANGQDPATLLGAILRLDVGEPGVARPADDAPFADGGGAPEVHLHGLRNPWRFSFDRLSGALWIADVGQNAFEEVNRLDPAEDAGGNLGGNVMEASHCYAEPGCSSEGLILPVGEYGRDLGCSITGGHVYRGDAIDGLGGWYLFADWCSGILFGLPSDVTQLTPPRPLLETGLAVSTFGEDAAGELYLADLAGGGLYRIVAGD